mmetsp:Transcript_94324/g.250490  ORF Transcript_94324/g.250490 Transcript_94324/m.250490 type:complete len:404 (-) Transcript_94324:286-1497(-)
MRTGHAGAGLLQCLGVRRMARGFNVGARSEDVDASAKIAVPRDLVPPVRGADGDGVGHEGGSVVAGIVAFVACGNNNGYATVDSSIERQLLHHVVAIAAQAHAHDGGVLSVLPDPINRHDHPGGIAPTLTAYHLYAVDDCLLCDAVGGAANDSRAMGTVPVQVLRARVVAVALPDAAQCLERGNGAPLELLVRCPDAGVHYIDMDALPVLIVRRQVVAPVHAAAGVNAVEAPGHGRAGAELEELGPVVLGHVLLVHVRGQLRDDSPLRVGSDERERGPVVRVQLGLDVFNRSPHHEHAEAALIGVPFKQWHRALWYAVGHLLHIFVGAALRDRDYPHASAILCHLRVGMHVHLCTIVHLDTTAQELQVLPGVLILHALVLLGNLGLLVLISNILALLVLIFFA